MTINLPFFYFRERLQEFLEQNDFLPLSTWNSFQITHAKPLSDEEKKATYSKIKRTVEKKEGLYVYEQGGEILYVGQGKLYERLRNHYRESYEKMKVFVRTLLPWYEFFAQHRGELKVYWRELADEDYRKMVEHMLAFVLSPDFLRFKREMNSKV